MTTDELLTVQRSLQSKLSIKALLKAELVRVISLYGQVVMAADTRIIAIVMAIQIPFIQVSSKTELCFRKLKNSFRDVGSKASNLLMFNHLK